jgi:cellulose synthase/poly-beta-1,6-N-acetylglucosamine synthase-like glycosyltransferase
MSSKRLLIENDIIHYRYVILNALLCFVFITITIKSMSSYSAHVQIPLILLLFFTTWEFFSYVLLNIEMAFSSSITRYKSTGNITKYPTIAIIIPSYNEPFEVAKMTFDSAVNMKYKGYKEIIVVDNSTQTNKYDFLAWKNYVDSFGDNYSNIKARFIFNDSKKGLKPGNLDIGQEYIEEAEYVIFLDVDSTFPHNENIIDKSILEFNKDKSLGWIQFLTKSTNHNFNKCSRSIGIFQNLLRLTCYFRSLGGFTLFYGHNAIWKKSCLLRLGPWLEFHRGQIMVTEDILKSILAYKEGYYGKSIPIETGEWVPNSLRALECMWQRWTYGTCQIIGKYFFLILKSKQMTFLEKYDLLHSIFLYWAYAITYPLAILYQLLLPPETSWVFILIFCILPQVFSGITIYKHNIKYQNNSSLQKLINFYVGTFIISGFVIIVQLKGTYNYLLNKPQGWKVTAKGIENSESIISMFKKYSLYIAFSLLMLLSSFISWYINFGNQWVKLINYFPVIFISINLLLSIFIYGKSGRIKENCINEATIDYIKKDHLHLFTPIKEQNTKRKK